MNAFLRDAVNGRQSCPSQTVRSWNCGRRFDGCSRTIGGLLDGAGASPCEWCLRDRDQKFRVSLRIRSSRRSPSFSSVPKGASSRTRSPSLSHSMCRTPRHSIQPATRRAKEPSSRRARRYSWSGDRNSPRCGGAWRHRLGGVTRHPGGCLTSAILSRHVPTAKPAYDVGSHGGSVATTLVAGLLWPQPTNRSCGSTPSRSNSDL